MSARTGRRPERPTPLMTATCLGCRARLIKAGGVRPTWRRSLGCATARGYSKEMRAGVAHARLRRNAGVSHARPHSPHLRRHLVEHRLLVGEAAGLELRV